MNDILGLCQKKKKVAVIQNIDTIFSFILSLHQMSIMFFHLVATTETYNTPQAYFSSSS